MKSLRTNPVVWGTVIAAVTLVLGYSGYRADHGPDLSRTDAVFRSLQLFALDGDFARPDIPWQLNVARFLAPLLVVGATLLVLMAFLRDQFHRALISLFYRHHVVVIGLTPSTALVAQALRATGRRVVAIASDPTNPRLPGLRAVGVRVIIGDPRQRVTLRRASVDRASEVVVTTGSDAQNLEVADLLRMDLDPHNKTTLHVAIDDPALWVELGQLTLEQARQGVVIECFNEVDRTAGRLLEEALSTVGVTTLDRVLIDGEGPLTHRLLTHLVRRALIDGHRPEIQLTPTSYRQIGPHLEAEEWLEQSADLRLVTDPDTAAVAFVYRRAADAAAIASGLELARTTRDLRVFVALEGQISDAVLQLGGDSERVHLVSVSAEAVAEGFLQRSGVELMARARHDDYVEQERARGVTSTQNPSLVPWEQLPESLRSSNRRFAVSVGATLDVMGARLRPMRGAVDPNLPLDDVQLERLAKREHDRWMADLVADGWVYRDGPKDAAAKTHPLIVGWDDLDEPERQKDRDAIFAIPRMLARIGYEIVPPARSVATQEGP